MDNAAMNPRGNNRGVFGSFIAEIVEGVTPPNVPIPCQIPQERYSGQIILNPLPCTLMIWMESSGLRCLRNFAI